MPSVAPGSGYAVLAQRTGDGAWLRMFNPRSLGLRQTFKLAGAPNGSRLTSWPFASYTVGATVRHVDLTGGLRETMAEVGPGALPGVVVNS